MKLAQYPFLSNKSEEVVPLENLQGIVTSRGHRNSERDLQEPGQHDRSEQTNWHVRKKEFLSH
jgi:hypothetical protein